MIVAIATSFVASVALTHVVKWQALRFGFVDLPDGLRKIHRKPVALGGGVALIIVCLGATVAVHLCSHVWLPLNCALDSRLWVVMAAGAVIAGVGVADDRRALSPGTKLLGQLAAAAILAAGGVVVHKIHLGGMQVDLGSFAIPLTVFGLIAAMNAVNLLDGADGAASGISAVMLLTLACFAAILGKPHAALLSVLFANAVLGVLWHNAPPARIYLGDAGSMFLGLVLGSLTILVADGSQGLPGYPALAIWTIPVLDSAAAITRRRLNRRPVFRGDRAHIHHCLRSLLGSDLAVLACLVTCCIVPSASAVASLWFQNHSIALVGFFIVPAVLVGSGVFGRAEIGLLIEQARGSRRVSEPRPATLATIGGKPTINVRERAHEELGTKVPKKTSVSLADTRRSDAITTPGREKRHRNV